MALDMSSATYARDEAGRKKLLTDLQGDISKAIKTVENESKTVEGTIQKYWLGADATQFIKSFKSATNEIATLYKQYNSMITAALNEDTKQFSSMQAKNANTIKSSIQGIK